jgi:hypothetical protein
MSHEKVTKLVCLISRIVNPRAVADENVASLQVTMNDSPAHHSVKIGTSIRAVAHVKVKRNNA